ncbi:dsDNA nuclease domain-containing protein [Caballeronia sp. AZ7_KS35]|uniref:CD-NTase-associated endodeoxyribonuclease Cap4 n=1 Tax=Caballeronia sp. AZ7_KS35 TaxID=2921762 RepID=UPI0020295835|nr:dsDNA nuclease domain-containing protein [Caballeronia sp. AZ7_KS35]
MKTPLFERQSVGGVIARDGFEYQDSYLLQKFPFLLSQSAFSHAVSEVLGDVEIRYFRPTGGTLCELYEAKGYQLTKAAFWEEIERFKHLHTEAPDEYVRFSLVCDDFNNEFGPLFRMLERYRGVGQSLNADSKIRQGAVGEVIAAVVALGQSQATAEFVLNRVSFSKHRSSDADGAFTSNLNSALPVLGDMRSREIDAFRKNCANLVNTSAKHTVYRADIEHALLTAAPSERSQWLSVAAEISLQSCPPCTISELSLDVGAFNGEKRGSLGIEQWHSLQTQLEELSGFLHASRAGRAIALSAKQRISLACVIGHTFSATRGHTLRMTHNGSTFDTSDHERVNGPFFQVTDITAAVPHDEAVAAISFPYSQADDVKLATDGLGLRDLAQLHLASSKAIENMKDLNTAVHEAKAALSSFRSRHRLKRLHLFIKAPAVFAMALGHRLNGIGTIQLYDWIDLAYKPTAELT